MWEELNKFYLMVRSQAAGRLAVDAALRFLQSDQAVQPFARGDHRRHDVARRAWHFARMGRLVERADKTSRILDVKYFVLLPNVAEVGTPLDTIQWSALLEVGQRAGNVSQAIRPDHADERGRVPDARPRISPRDALLPAQGRGIAAGDHRQPARHFPHAGRTAAGPLALRTRLRPYRRDHPRWAARIHRPLPDEAEPGRRGDLGDIFLLAPRPAGPRYPRPSAARMGHKHKRNHRVRPCRSASR